MEARAEAREEKAEARAVARHEFLGASGRIDTLRKRNDDLADDVVFRRNGRHNIGGESRRNRGRSGAAGSL
jgi:hypothetical protein